MKKFSFLLLALLSFNLFSMTQMVVNENKESKAQEFIFLPIFPGEIWNIIFQFLKNKDHEISLVDPDDNDSESMDNCLTNLQVIKIFDNCKLAKKVKNNLDTRVKMVSRDEITISVDSDDDE